MAKHKNLLVQTIRTPAISSDFPLSDWDLLIRQANRSDMLAQLWYAFAKDNLISTIPTQPRPHFESAHVLAEGHSRAIRWEITRVSRALRHCDTPVILLKGAAYLLSELPFAKGRIFSDIDLLIDRSKLDEAERILRFNGWVSTHHDSYDQRYFREWMHELPPLKHTHRGSVLDIHHTILPVTAKLKPDAGKLFSAIVPLEDTPNVYTLAPLDMVLHSATHLFHEGEFEHGFRGLTDLDGLLRHFSEIQTDFWPDLLDRAAELDLKKPLYYALRYSQALLKTPVPENFIEDIGDGIPKGWKAKVMDALFMRALMPYHPSCDLPTSGLARWLLFVRAHYLKMPFYILIPHLIRKAVRRKAGLEQN